MSLRLCEEFSSSTGWELEKDQVWNARGWEPGCWGWTTWVPDFCQFPMCDLKKPFLGFLACEVGPRAARAPQEHLRGTKWTGLWRLINTCYRAALPKPRRVMSSPLPGEPGHQRPAGELRTDRVEATHVLGSPGLSLPCLPPASPRTWVNPPSCHLELRFYHPQL